MAAAPNQYDIGQAVTISTAITAEATGAPVDPTDVYLFIEAPDPSVWPLVEGGITQYKLSLGQIIRDGVGLYHLDFTPPVHGWWNYKWQGVGAVVCSGADARFYVRPSFAIAG